VKFSDVIHQALTGRPAEPVTGQEMFERMTESYRASGMSRRAFARATGIAESTLRYWGDKGVSARRDDVNLPRLTRAYRASLANSAKVEQWRQNNITIQLGGIPRTARNVTADKLGLRPGTGALVVNAYLNGDDAGAARIFAQGVRDQFYRHSVFGKWLPASGYDDLEDLAYEGEYEDDADSYFGVTVSA
jgi:hypothetical protein